MEIKVNLRRELILNLLNILKKMEFETTTLWMFAFLLVPFIIGSMWSLWIALVCQLFWLGVKAGVLFFFFCVFTLVLLRVANVSTPSLGGLKCTLMDVVLTLLYQAGFQIPSFLWHLLLPLARAGAGGSGMTPDVDHGGAGDFPLVPIASILRCKKAVTKNELFGLIKHPKYYTKTDGSASDAGTEATSSVFVEEFKE